MNKPPGIRIKQARIGETIELRSRITNPISHTVVGEYEYHDTLLDVLLPVLEDAASRNGMPDFMTSYEYDDESMAACRKMVTRLMNASNYIATQGRIGQAKIFYIHEDNVAFINMFAQISSYSVVAHNIPAFRDKIIGHIDFKFLPDVALLCVLYDDTQDTIRYDLVTDAIDEQVFCIELSGPIVTSRNRIDKIETMDL